MASHSRCHTLNRTNPALRQCDSGEHHYSQLLLIISQSMIEMQTARHHLPLGQRFRLFAVNEVMREESDTVLAVAVRTREKGLNKDEISLPPSCAPSGCT